MDVTAARLVAARYRQTHERALALLDDLSEEQLAWRPAGGAHSAAWIALHLARWADHLADHLPRMAPELGRRLGPGRQLWEAEGLAARWGLDPALLGEEQTGMLMADGDAARLALPPKGPLLDYLRRAFALAERAVAVVDDATFRQPSADRSADRDAETIGDAILSHFAHENRHLGELESLRGLQGLRGTATA